MELSTQDLLQAIIEEYHKVFQEIHRMPLYKIGKSYHPNTDTDFALVCPNCHAMLHRNREEPLLPEDLRGIIVKQN